MDQVLGLRCTICGAEYRVDEVEYVCPRHGGEGTLDVVYDYGLLARRISPGALTGDPERSMWRYLPLLPVDPEGARRLARGSVLASVGWTPLYPAPRLAARLGLRHLWVKDDGREPTASFKDRASAIAVVKAREKGYPIVTTASTGNAAAALAGLCAGLQPGGTGGGALRSVIFVPRTAPQAKIAQLLVFGATVLLVDGSYDDAYELCLQAAPAFGWYNRSTGYNPYMSEGKKTAAYEICEQLTAQGGPGDAPLCAPERIFCPVGDGCIIGGLYKGLQDLQALGWIDHMPRLMGVQAAGSSPLVDAWERARDRSGPALVQAALEMRPVQAHTVADSICAGLPRDRIKALRAVVESGGAMIRVSDEEILPAIPALARGCGVFAEPAAAAAYAGLAKAVEGGWIDASEQVVVLATGSGLKDVDAAIQGARLASATLAGAAAPAAADFTVSPTLADVRRVMGAL